MAQGIRVICYGLGPIGERIAKLVSQRDGMEIVGAIELVNLGTDIGEVIGLDRKLGVRLTNNVDTILSQGADVVIQATGSSLLQVKEQLIPMMKAGINVVSTCEELAYPWDKQPGISTEIDALAKENNVTVLSTGVNPGFCMDTFPIVMTGVCEYVEKVKVARIQDARPRRLPFQKKIGAGCTLTEFEELKASGTLRHVGLEESVGMIAAALGWKVDEYTETIAPIIAEDDVSSDYLMVKAGQVAGVEQIAIGKANGKEIIRMEFQAYLGAPEPHDTVYITGRPNMKVTVEGGTQGDIATTSIVVNAIPRVINAPSGLMTMKDMPIVTALGLST